MLDQKACCFAVSGGRTRRSVAPLCVPHGGSVGLVAVVELVGVVAVVELVGVVAVVELVGWLLMVVLARFHKPRASVSVLIRHWSVVIRASASESLPSTAVAMVQALPFLSEPFRGAVLLLALVVYRRSSLSSRRQYIGRGGCGADLAVLCSGVAGVANLAQDAMHPRLIVL